MIKLKSTKFSNLGIITVTRGGSEQLVASHLSPQRARAIALRAALTSSFCRVVDLNDSARLVDMAWVPKGARHAVTTSELARNENQAANRPIVPRR